MRHRWIAIGKDVAEWCDKFSSSQGLHYAVVFEGKNIMDKPIKEVFQFDDLPNDGARWPETDFGTSELRDNPDLMLVDFELHQSIEEYELTVSEIDWTKMPAARMIVSIENGKWAGRLLSIE